MEKIPDDPIIRCMERTGFPPWMDDDYEEEEEEPDGEPGFPDDED